jgi:pimeloyl-ACP methyl ester carboxylesterase
MKYLFIAFSLTATVAVAQTPIDTAAEISVGGIRQYVTIESKDRALPLLLFLHGGPGGSVMNYAHKFTNKLRDHFVVIQWDQRQTGKTKEMNVSQVPLSLEVFQNDTHEIIVALLKKFNRKKLYIVGHSWGTALGFHIAGKYPELLYAYVAIGAMINQLESERLALAMMKEAALKKDDRERSDELAGVKIPFENGEQLYYHRKSLLAFSGSRKALSKEYVEEWAQTWLKVFNDASRENLFQTLTQIKCPVYFMAGRKDYQTNSSIAEQYFRAVSAPKKAFFWFENSGHSIPSSDPSRLQHIIIDNILPATFTIQKPGALISTQ